MARAVLPQVSLLIQLVRLSTVDGMAQYLSHAY
jgi:hypothetical protein